MFRDKCCHTNHWLIAWCNDFGNMNVMVELSLCFVTGVVIQITG